MERFYDMRNAVIVSCGRSAIGKAPKGSLKDTRTDEIGAQVLTEVINRAGGIDPSLIEDLIIGCATPEAEQGFNVAKTIAFRAGLPPSVPAQTINRFCASGLQSVATAAYAIMSGQTDVVAAGGIESMSMIPMGGYNVSPTPYLMKNYPNAFISMGITAENVAAKYGVTREAQDEFAYLSHKKAAGAQMKGLFDDEIVPIDAVKMGVDDKGRPVMNTYTFAKDEGVRAITTPESLAKLRPVFKKDGTVTAGNSSQMSDGAAMAILMAEGNAAKSGIKPLANMLSFAVAGTDPAYMGIGPVEAIPKALKIAGKKLSDIQLIELNEAFASQAIACMRELDLNPDIVNVNGGAIALGHPLGCTGTLLLAKLIYEMHRRGDKYGMISMCIGGGMGAAAVFEML